MDFNAFSGLHEGLVLLKDLSKPSMPNRTYMVKIILKICLQFTGPTPHGFTWGLVLLKDLPKTTNTVWYFHAQIKNGKMDNIYNNVVNNVNNQVWKRVFLWVQCRMDLHGV
jgi:hypothetical protein